MRILAAALMICALASTSWAGSLTVTVNTTATQDAKLEKMLARINRDACARAGLPPSCTDVQLKAVMPSETIYPTVLAWTEAQLVSVLKAHIALQAEARHRALAVAYEAATPAKQAEADAVLGVQ